MIYAYSYIQTYTALQEDGTFMPQWEYVGQHATAADAQATLAWRKSIAPNFVPGKVAASGYYNWEPGGWKWYWV